MLHLSKFQYLKSYINKASNFLPRTIPYSRQNHYGDRNETATSVLANDYQRIYMKNIAKLTTMGTSLGILSAYLGSFTPAGLPMGYLILASTAASQIGETYIENTRPKILRLKESDGSPYYSHANAFKRQMSFFTISAAAACYLVPLLEFIGVSSFLVYYGGFISVSSLVGHLFYSKILRKGTEFKISHSFTFGMMTGLLGLNLMNFGIPLVFPLEHLEGLEGTVDQAFQIGGLLSLSVYNMFYSFDCKRILRELGYGRDDFLKHAIKCAELWLATFIPLVLFL